MTNNRTVKQYLTDIKPYYNCLNNNISNTKDKELHECLKCNLNFIRRPYVFYNNSPEEFCKVCNTINSPRWYEYDFLKQIQMRKPKYNGLYFVSSYSRENLRGVNEPLRGTNLLTVDLAILSSSNLTDMPIAVFEVFSEKYISNLVSNQGNLGTNYKRKKDYYKSSFIPFLEVIYNDSKPFDYNKIDIVIERVLYFHKNATQNREEYNKLFPYCDIRKFNL